MPQGTHANGHQAKKSDDWRPKTGKKKSGKKTVADTGGHKNKYAEFSKAASAQANLEIRREQEAKKAAREEEERRFGYRPYR